MLRPIYDQQKSRSGRLTPALRKALQWWCEILSLRIAEKRSWHAPETGPVHLFCDAAGDPAHLGAVLWLDGKVLYTHCAPPASIVELLDLRSDNQIMGLEQAVDGSF